jgi:hypothetical protein
MPYIEFTTLQPLTPRAAKLYLYFLHRAEHTGQDTLSMSLAQLGQHSGLQTHAAWKAPSQWHGNDGAVRNALHELVQRGLIEKRAGQGRQPNTYRLLLRRPQDQKGGRPAMIH